MKILLMGPQGSGKGTAGEKLSEKLQIPLIGVGQTLRDLPKNTPESKKLQECLDKGDLAPNYLIAEILRKRVALPDCSKGYILDGWGRKMSDIELFDPGFDKVISLILSKKTSLIRISGRRTCDSDGKIYNIYTLPKKELKKCQGKLVQRSDDTKEAVNKRLNIFYTETKPVIEYFRQKGLLVEVDGEPWPDTVVLNLCYALGLN